MQPHKLHTGWTDADYRCLVELITEYMKNNGLGLTDSIGRAAIDMGRTYGACRLKYQLFIKPNMSEEFRKLVGGNKGIIRTTHKERLLRRIELFDEKIKRLEERKKQALDMLIENG